MQHELIEMLEKMINHFEYISTDSYYAKETGAILSEAEKLVEKAKKNNVPAVPQDVPSGEVVAWMVYGNYTRQPFGMLSSAEAYLRGLLKSDPDGGYHIRPLTYATPVPSNEPAQCVPDVLKKPYKHNHKMTETESAFADGWNACRKAVLAATPAPAPAQEVGLTDEERADMACAVAAICTGTSSRTVAATAIEWTERALRAKGNKL